MRHDQDNDWPDNLTDYASRFNQCYPLLANEMRYFLAQAQQPDENSDLFLTRLRLFKYWLEQENQRIT